MLSRRVIASPQRRRSISRGHSSAESSSGNEYAEGLGCADRKACRARPSSNFEFDNHPREEYFEQPESVLEPISDDSRSDDEHRQQLPACFPQNAVSGTSMLSALAELQEQASRRESDREQFVRQKMAAISRRADRRLAKRDREASCAETAREAKAARKHKVSTKMPPTEDVLKEYCKELVAIRGRMDAAGSLGVVDRSRIVDIFRALESVHMDAPLLKLSGLGLELNHSSWKRHPLSKLATRSAALVHKWRTSYHLQRQQKRDAVASIGCR